MNRQIDEYINHLRCYPDFCGSSEDINIEFQNAHEKSLANIKTQFKPDRYYKGNSELEKTVSLMDFVHNELFCVGGQAKPESMNTIEIMKVRKQGSLFCSGYATVMTELLLSLDKRAVKITCLPKIFDHDCHVAVLVYLEDIKKWGFFDPTFNTYFYDENNSPLNLLEIRNSYCRRKIPYFRHIRINKQWMLVLNNVIYETYDDWYSVYMAKNCFRFICPEKSEFNLSSNKSTKYIFINPQNYKDKNEYDTSIENVTYTNSLLLFS